MAKYIIVGGVAGGATAAARLRRVDESAEIILLERGEHISYANCGLPYYIGGVITDRSKLLVQTPESFNARFNIDIRINSEATKIDRESREVTIYDKRKDSYYTESYDKLILSPGASALKPPIEGINSSNIFTLRNVTDTDSIKSYIDQERPAKGVVIGGGFVGVEMAENLHLQGVDTTLIEGATQILAPLDGEMAAQLHQHFKVQNVGLLLNDPVSKFEHHTSGDRVTTTIHLKSGRSVEADFIILSIGVRPENILAKDAGLDVGKSGGIVVNSRMQTSDSDIYALGDAIEFPNPITGEPGLSLLAGPANKQGRIVADNITFNNKKEWRGSIGTAIAKVFDMTTAVTGANEKTLKRLNIPYLTTTIISGSHAGYYPGSTQMTIKITFTPEGKLLGGQIVGMDGVDSRINMVATTIQHGGTIYDLQEIEHAYAPPFSSAKDPINQIGFNAENILDRAFTPITLQDIVDIDFNTTQLIDVRTAVEFELNSIEGAINIDVNSVRENLDKIDKSKKIYLYCGTGLRSYVASRVLANSGYNTYNLSGGFKLYSDGIAEQENIRENSINSSRGDMNNSSKSIKVIDACGLQCPGPILKLKEEIDQIEVNESITLTSNDAGFYKDVESWCNVTGNRLVAKEQKRGVITATIEKLPKSCSTVKASQGDDKTIVCFSDDMDRALASFVIANGAASMGKKVTLFFTFWGLNIIKRADKPKVEKDMMGKMFSKMMPSHSSKLKLSNLNMAGIGSKMMKGRMKQKNVDMLETMINKALEGGVKMIACQMSMDIMGVHKDEFIDGVEIGGVANYLENAETSNVNLFI